MKVCDLTYAYNEVSGGIRTYIDAKRAYLRDHTDWEHVLIIPGTEDTIEREGRLSVYRVASPILPGSAPYRLIIRVNKVREILRETQPDVIELGSMYTLPWTAFRHRKQQPCTVFGFYHTDFADVYVRPAAEKLLGETLGRGARNLAVKYTRAVFGRCDATVTASPALHTKLQQMGIPHVEHVPLGVDLDTFHPSQRDDATRQRFDAGPNDLMLVYAGRFDVEKRVHHLVNAFQQLPATVRASLVLVGQGPLEEELREKAQHTERLFILPFQKSKPELARLLASADLYLAANPHETFGLSVVEAQACGLPVLGVRSGALIERVPPELGRLVAPDSADALAQGIVALAGTDLKETGRRARQHVEAQFGWNATFRQLCDLYSQYAKCG